ASATPDASPRPERSSSHSSARLSDRAAATSRRSRVRSRSARPRSVMLLSISPKKDVFIGSGFLEIRRVIIAEMLKERRLFKVAHASPGRRVLALDKIAAARQRFPRFLGYSLPRE